VPSSVIFIAVYFFLKSEKFWFEKYESGYGYRHFKKSSDERDMERL
jgi:hypothetical protein